MRAIIAPINNIQHGRNYFAKERLFDLVSKAGLEMDNKILGMDKFGSFLEKATTTAQNLLGNRSVESDRFEDYTCLRMIREPKRVCTAYEFALSVLFTFHKMPYYVR